MAKSTQTIEIDGNQYDAVTGQLVSSVKKLAQQAVKPVRALNIDGVVRSSSTRRPATGVHRRQQRSTILMRSAVSKPTRSKKPVASPPKVHLQATGPNQSRLWRAQKTPKNSLISRFGSSVSSQPVTKNEKSTAAHKPGHKPAAAAASATASPLPSMVTSVSHHKLERLLDQALTNASSHKQRLTGRRRWHHTKRSPRLLPVSLVLAVAVLVAGFFAWQNVPQVAVRVASVQSDVDAGVPSYSPSGFSFSGPLAITDNAVSMKFISNADPGRNYEIVQRNSDWDSASLLANYLEPKSEPYQTSNVKGSTVYIYGANNHATWVNGGTWYQINDNANLNSDQLLKIAESL